MTNLAWLWKLVLTIVAILVPVHSVLIATGVLIGFDLCTGLWRAKKAGEKITSYGLRRTVTKVIGYQTAIITAFVMQTYLIPIVPVVSIVSGLIGMTEGKSILENLSLITGIDFWAAIKEKLQNVKDQPKS